MKSQVETSETFTINRRSFKRADIIKTKLLVIKKQIIIALIQVV